MALTDLLVISHTHWDREWYHSVDEFRARLVRLIDELLDAPPEPGQSFLLDGQAVLLDDYLSVRPERAAELSALLREGRIEAGPWYVLADELIPSGEALVRNLLVGLDTVRRLRGATPDVLYCPDSFGHPAMLPAIAAGFGCTVIVLWRGLGGARSPSADMMRWRAADGSEALVYHLPPDGYEFGSSLPADEHAAAERWARIHDVMNARANTGHAVLLNGADHHARQANLSAALAVLQASANSVRVRASSLASASKELRAAVSHVELPVISGELRDSYGYAWTLGGTLGTRAYQKRQNAIAERLLFRDVEPWIALSSLKVDSGSRALLTSALRTLLLAHPHDTLCGTSLDTVAVAMDARIQSAIEQARSVRTEALHDLIGHDSERARTEQTVWQPAVVIRNPAARRRGGVVELTLREKIADVAVGPGSATRQGTAVKPAAFLVDGVRVQVLAREERVELTESRRAYPDADRILEARAVGWMDEIGGYTVETRGTRGRKASAVHNTVVATPTTLENGRVRVEVDASGVVSFRDQSSGRSIANLLRFERAEDVGDLYTPAIRASLDAPTFVRARLVHRGPIRGAIALEYRVGGKGKRSGGHCTLTLQLDADAPFLALHINGENRDENQRLRVCVATGLANAKTFADAAFGPQERLPLTISPSDEQMEHVVPTAPLHRWVARVSESDGVALISDGLAEYESFSDGGVAITLVRSVGELSRHDLPERPGHAGWPARTPGAQCIGAYEARLAVQCVRGPLRDMLPPIERLAEDILTPLTGETLRSNLFSPRSAGGLELEGSGLAFSAAMPAREQGWLTLRCVNLLDEPVSGAWSLAQPFSEARRARLDETLEGRIDVAEKRISFVAQPREIVTILVR